MEEQVNTKVYVSFIESVNKFYVQVARDVKSIIQIQKELNSHRIRNKTGKLEVDDDDVIKAEDSTDRKEEIDATDVKLKPGDLVTAKFIQDKLLYRARVLFTFIELDNTLSEVEMAEVLYIDYGNTAAVPITSIRSLRSSLQSLPPLASQCSLFDCLPLGEDTTKEFRGMVSGHSLLLEIMDRREEILEVDLIREVGDNLGYTSVRDVLVLCGKAIFYSSPFTSIPNMEERNYKQLPPLKAGSVHTVMLSHLHQLSHQQLPQLSVQLLSDQDKLALQLPSLMDQMGAVYGVKRSEELWGLGRCWPGVVCAVRDSRDKMWYRGEVVTIRMGRMVLVKYVDFGNSELIPAHRLRRLFMDFMELPAMATRVCLGVKVEGEEVLGMLREDISLVDLTMKVVEEGCGDVLPTVELEVEGVSVNKWLKEFLG